MVQNIENVSFKKVLISARFQIQILRFHVLISATGEDGVVVPSQNPSLQNAGSGEISNLYGLLMLSAAQKLPEMDDICLFVF